ncbi:MAG: nucleoside deaminase [Rhodospirillaceae bacterium]|jgi:tRNA(adenine34) deaminase|nr:nucleoside deaminase [Rhodospirillaceae bacterium]
MNPFMAIAIAEAEASGNRGEIPVGAVVVKEGIVLARTGNMVCAWNDPTAHAEIVAIRMATKFQESPRLDECDLWVTLEPCSMCAMAMKLSRIRRLYFGAYNIKNGGVDHGSRVFDRDTCYHPEVIGGLEERYTAELLVSFFRERR